MRRSSVGVTPVAYTKRIEHVKGDTYLWPAPRSRVLGPPGVVGTPNAEGRGRDALGETLQFAEDDVIGIGVREARA